MLAAGVPGSSGNALQISRQVVHYAVYAYIICIISMDTEYDRRKAQSNLKKHGLTFEEASTALLDYQNICAKNMTYPKQNP